MSFSVRVGQLLCPELARRTRFATPEPVALGEPGAGYPLPWSVQTWLPGVTATGRDPGDSVPFARDLAEFIAGVRAIDTRGRRFSGAGRGVTCGPTTSGWTPWTASWRPVQRSECGLDCERDRQR
jgi:aminoglycoside phosphotransferase (APT) family kinase protein